MSATLTGAPLTVAIMMSLNCAVASMRPMVRRLTSHLPCSSVPPGISTFLLLDGVPHLIDRQAVRVQLLDVDDDVDLARALAADAHGANAVDRFQRTRDLLIRDLGQRAQAGRIAREQKAHDGI